jgi:ferredoxin
MFLNIVYSVVSVFVFACILGVLLLLTSRLVNEKSPVSGSGKRTKRTKRSSQAVMVPQVRCKGGREQAVIQFEYRGLSDCNALVLLFGGNKICKHGCLGLGSCVNVCPSGAAQHDNNGLVFIDKDLCISCLKCIDVCPTGVIVPVPAKADYFIACNSNDTEEQIRKSCTVGCIGCKLCEERFPNGGFRVNDMLADIDYSYRGNRAEAAKECPAGCIYSLKPHTGMKKNKAKKLSQEPDEGPKQKT